LTEPEPRPEREPSAPADSDVHTGPQPDDPNRFADLEERPVNEHVAAFEAEHDRLQRELGTIDQL
jgi:hypothetical protein